MPKYLSGRVKKTPQSELSNDRNRYLSLADAEPNIGDPSLVPQTLPVGQQYQVISILGYPGERYWIPVGGGLIPGTITVYDEGIIVPNNAGVSSISQLNFVGAAVSARGYLNPDGSPGIGATITVFAPGNNQELLFNNNNDFGTSSKLKFDSVTGLLSVQNNISIGSNGTTLITNSLGNIGIGTTLPTQKLDVNGGLRLRETIYDYYNNPGNTSQLLVKNSLGGINWINQETLRVGAGGTYTNIQYHNSAGLIDGASNFIFNPTNNRVGIGSTLPQQLLDVLGYAKFTGQTEIQNLNVTGVGTISRLNVSNLTTTRDLRVVGFTTFDQFIDVNGGAYIDNIQLGILNDNTINTTSGNLTLDSSGGTVTVNDNLTVTTSGTLMVQNITDSSSKDTGSLVVEGGVGIEKKLYVGGTINVLNDILPITGNSINLGSSSLKWDNIYTNTLTGNIIGNAESATALQTSRNFSIIGDVDAPAVSFNGTGNVVLNAILNNSGVSAGTYGSSTIVPVFAVDAKGRVTSVTNTEINFSSAAVAQADKLTNTRTISATNDISWSVNFDGSTNVTSAATLSNTGVSAGTYGSSTQVGTFTVDSKGRLTSASNVSINFSTATVAQSDTIKTVSSSTNANFFLTFVDSNNSPAAYEALYTDAGISYNPSSNALDLTGALTVGETLTANGDVDLGNATSDTVTFTARVDSDILPSTNNTRDLGSSSLKWNEVYATTFVGAIAGNADTATKLQTARNIAITGDLSWNVNFDGSANVTSTGTLANSGVSAGTYGSSTAVGQFTVDTKGRITSASNVNVNFAAATVLNSDNIKTVSTATNATFYPTFVDSNNGTAAYESLYTDAGLSYNPSTNLLSVSGNFSSGGKIIPSAGTGDNGIVWNSDPGGGSGDVAFIQYYAESGENTRLHIGIRNDADDDLYLEATETTVSGNLSVLGSVTFGGTSQQAIGGITIKDEGTTVGTANGITSINFVGDDITATASGANATITLTTTAAAAAGAAAGAQAGATAGAQAAQPFAQQAASSAQASAASAQQASASAQQASGSATTATQQAQAAAQSASSATQQAQASAASAQQASGSATSAAQSATAAAQSAAQSESGSFQTGTTLLFYQANAPTGWTKVTTHNNKALRVVSGTGGGSGGTTAFTSVFTSRTPSGTVSGSNSGGSVSNTTLTIAQMPSHTHDLNWVDISGGDVWSYIYNFSRQGVFRYASGSRGGDGAHDHGFVNPTWSGSFTGTALDFAVQYIDIIIASKN